MADDAAKSRLRDLIKKLVAVPDTEEQLNKITDEINHLSPDSAWSNYIFYSAEFETEISMLIVVSGKLGPFNPRNSTA